MVFLFVFLALLLIMLLVSYGIYRFVLYAPLGDQNDPHHVPEGEQYAVKRDQMLALIDDLCTLPYEAVTITSRDGLRLAASLYPGQLGRPVDICCHGYRGLGVRDFCGGVQTLLRQGNGVLLIHQRGQGDSAGHTMTFGVREREDVLLWAQYAEKRFGPDTPLFLHGISMGAATVLMASALPLPKSVKGILADCPYDVPRDIIIHTANGMKLPGGLMWPLLWLGAWLFGGFRFGDLCCHEAVRHAAVPIQIIHGEDDRFVPASMSEPIARANPRLVTRITFPNAGHGLSYLQDTPRYEAITQAFMDSCLKGS